MSNFPQKNFEGQTYDFNHLVKIEKKIQFDSIDIDLIIRFSIHCFTEAFDENLHQDHHRYSFNGETRAFDITRYQCSLFLPEIIEKIQYGMIYSVDKGYTHVATISLNHMNPNEKYSIFFNLKKHKKHHNVLLMFIKSAYLKPLVIGSRGKKSERFKGLIARTIGLKKEKGP